MAHCEFYARFVCRPRSLSLHSILGSFVGVAVKENDVDVDCKITLLAQLLWELLP